MAIIYRLSADIIIIVHSLWIAFLILGFPVLLYFNLRKWRYIHLGALLVTAAMQWTRTICPLTLAEYFFKSQGSSRLVYPGQFMTELIEKWIYLDEPVLEKLAYLTVLYCVVVLLSFRFRPVRKNPRTKPRRAYG
ncbi:MAG: DUF2784 family protein [Syntrophales bacterium]